MRGPEVLGDDQIEALAERFFGRKAEQLSTGAVPAYDLPGAIGTDQCVSDLINYRLGQFGLHFHGCISSSKETSAKKERKTR